MKTFILLAQMLGGWAELPGFTTMDACEAAAASLTTSLVWETECVPVEMRAGTRFAPDMSPVPEVRNLAGDNVHSATIPLRSLGCFSSFCRATYAKMARRSVVAPAESPIPRPRQ